MSSRQPSGGPPRSETERAKQREEAKTPIPCPELGITIEPATEEGPESGVRAGCKGPEHAPETVADREPDPATVGPALVETEQEGG